VTQSAWPPSARRCGASGADESCRSPPPSRRRIFIFDLFADPLDDRRERLLCAKAWTLIKDRLYIVKPPERLHFQRIAVIEQCQIGDPALRQSVPQHLALVACADQFETSSEQILQQVGRRSGGSNVRERVFDFELVVRQRAFDDEFLALLYKTHSDAQTSPG
jgi:hypothetical protein